MLRSLASGRLLGRVTGDERPVVLALHGWARDHHDFDAVLAPSGEPPLCAVALDLPGFGSAPPPPEPWGSPEYAQAVSAVFDDMAAPVVVVGHSFGGRVAVQLAANWPDMVAALVLTGVPLFHPSGRPARVRWRYRAVRRLHRVGLVSDERIERAAQRHGSADYRSARGVMRQVLVRTLSETYEGALSAIGCPTILVWGDDDGVAPLAIANEAAEHLRRAELRCIPGAGHLLPRTAPGALRQAVTDSLAWR